MPKNIVNILALTLITLLLWVAFQIFQITTKSNIPTATEKQLTPIDPNLNTQLINDLKDKDKTLK